ncbi:hypothetical protein IQ265_00710 [Nodosilinea sp. LEGE 06152]|uniref:hypothetical protein n=1 Tax=Nodosilinea sp. LEGE 06152 TaxID=2777966 RepID=UPI001882C5D6|nr:hypothetical protein [Nodosilinea sp. LEGE 06152]MBE9155368.1 hypothetical protein [Nodosilinea sp. LEGE 06152]
MNSREKFIEALRSRVPITPRLEGPSEYQRNKQLVNIARLAAHGSMHHLHILCRMSEANKRTAWAFSTADAKERLKHMFNAPGVNKHGK